MIERLFSKLTFQLTLTNEHTKQLFQLAVSTRAVDYTSLVDEKRFFASGTLICEWLVFIYPELRHEHITV